MINKNESENLERLASAFSNCKRNIIDIVLKIENIPVKYQVSSDRGFRTSPIFMSRN